MSDYDTRCLPRSSTLDSSVALILQLFLLNGIRSNVLSSALYCCGASVLCPPRAVPPTRYVESSSADHMPSVLTIYQGLYVQRFFLGALESGVSPGWMLVVGGGSSF
jgi:hypothetical protein